MWYKNIERDLSMHYKNRRGQFNRFIRDCKAFINKKLIEKQTSFQELIDLLPPNLVEAGITLFAIILGIFI